MVIFQNHLRGLKYCKSLLKVIRENYLVQLCFLISERVFQWFLLNCTVCALNLTHKTLWLNLWFQNLWKKNLFYRRSIGRAFFSSSSSSFHSITVVFLTLNTPETFYMFFAFCLTSKLESHPVFCSQFCEILVFYIAVGLDLIVIRSLIAECKYNYFLCALCREHCF